MGQGWDFCGKKLGSGSNVKMMVMIHCGDNSDINSLAPRRFEWNFRHVIFKLMLVIDDWGIPCEIALIWMSLNFTDDQLTLVQVMAWCRQATSHYLSQCWPRSLSPYGVTRPQWVKFIFSEGRWLNSSVWYKTKFGSPNFGYHATWWLFVHRLPELVANISSQFYHLVNTGIAVGSLVR